MELLYRTAEWHGLAKLRMHTESSLALLESLTTEFGLLIQNFQELTCSHFATTELPRETAARKRREMNSSSSKTFQNSLSQAAVPNDPATERAQNTTEPASSASSGRKCQAYLHVEIDKCINYRTIYSYHWPKFCRPSRCPWPSFSRTYAKQHRTSTYRKSSS